MSDFFKTGAVSNSSDWPFDADKNIDILLWLKKGLMIYKGICHTRYRQDEKKYAEKIYKSNISRLI
jgi:hypothetical protein